MEVLLGVARDTDGATVTLNNGFAKLAVLEDNGAPEELRFEITAPGMTLSPVGGGGIAFLDQSGNEVGRILAPWATEANGRELQTSYSLSGNTLIQHIDTSGAIFPVTADPHFTWGWITGTVYFDKWETRLMADYVGFVGYFADFVPAPFDVLITGYSTYVHDVAEVAVAVDSCVKIKLPYFAVQLYSGGYCT